MKYTQKTYDKLYLTKLANRLGEMGLTFQELQYISERDFLKWRNVGKDLVEYTKLRLAAEGLSFGAYTIDFFKEHKDEIMSTSFAKKEQPSDTFDWDAFRRETAKDILYACLKQEVDGAYPDPEEVCGMAVLYVDELIRLLKSDGIR